MVAHGARSEGDRVVNRAEAVLNIAGAVLLPVGMWIQFGFGAFLITCGVVCFAAGYTGRTTGGEG
jgi:hypothetical protein